MRGSSFSSSSWGDDRKPGHGKRGLRVDGWIVRLLLLAAAEAAAWCVPVALGDGGGEGGRGGGVGRSLLSFRETQGNVSFQCSPSGPCLPCQYFEKNDEKYRCSETGYRIPLKCVEIQGGLKEEAGKKLLRRLVSFNDNNKFNSHGDTLSSIRHLKWRRLLDSSLASQSGKQSYVTYRSCLPAEAEEKLSVLGFEMIMVCLLLVSGPIVYVRQKRNITMAGAGGGRMSTNSLRL